MYWFIPTATVTILETEAPIVITDILTIDPNTTSVDLEKVVIPGKKQEKILTGEKQLMSVVQNR